MLKLTLNHSAIGCKVELDGQDISNHLVDVTITAKVGDLTTATLTYSGAVVVEGEAGRITLKQAEHYVTCECCRKAVLGENVEEMVIPIADVTTIGATARSYVAPVAARK